MLLDGDSQQQLDKHPPPSYVFQGAFLSWCQHRATELMAPLRQSWSCRAHPNCTMKLWRMGPAYLFPAVADCPGFTTNSCEFQPHPGAAHAVCGTQGSNLKLVGLCLSVCSPPHQTAAEQPHHAHIGNLQKQTPAKCFLPCWGVFLLHFGDVS